MSEEVSEWGFAFIHRKFEFGEIQAFKIILDKTVLISFLFKSHIM